jgi:broad specificity phosphatase PhoE
LATLVLVRHGQASWGSADYDRLSELGNRQAVSTGRALAALEPPGIVLSGAQARHRATAELATEAAGWRTEVRVETGWNEFGHRQVLAAYGVPPPDETSPEFGPWLHAALSRWVEGGSDADYDEPFAGFTSRVDVAMRRLREIMAPGDTAVVFTSLGPISWTVAALLGGQPSLWLRLTPSLVNAGVTRISWDEQGTRLATFNEHTHLPAEMLTFR